MEHGCSVSDLGLSLCANIIFPNSLKVLELYPHSSFSDLSRYPPDAYVSKV
jgi:hypothetical protein